MNTSRLAIVNAAACALVACGSAPASTPKVADCEARYAACVASSRDVDEYKACRAKVDAACLSDGGSQ